MPTQAQPSRGPSRGSPPVAGRAAFTLVEVLVVIAIIGALVALTVPAVNIAMRGIKQRAIALEVQALATAVEQYRNKYESYPPDGSDLAVMQAHFRKAFPQMAPSELTLLLSSVNHLGGNDGAIDPTRRGVMDPPEALVFFLGGFSDNPNFPFSGRGGPFFLTDSAGNQVNSAAATIATVQYNMDRENAFYEFKQPQLSVEVIGGVTVSNDEKIHFSPTKTNDLIPTYSPAGLISPFVYFDSRSYTVKVGNNLYHNHYTPAALGGVARPYRSDNVRTTAPLATNPNAHFRFMNEESFQLLSAGLDDSFGGIPGASGGGPVYFRFPSGDSLDFGSTPPAVGRLSRYLEASGGGSQQADNAANFAEGILEDALEN